MTASPLLDRVSRVIVRAAELPEETCLTPDTALIGAGLSLDSVAVVELLVGLEREFGIEIDPAELLEAEAFRTVSTLLAFLETKGSLKT